MSAPKCVGCPFRHDCPCPECQADPSTAPSRYCSPLACRCGHPACPAVASWVPREGQARVIYLPEPRTT